MCIARRIAVVLMTGALLVAAREPLSAEDLAKSGQLPDAVRALGVSQAQVLTTAEAERIRGKAGLSMSEGVIVQFAGTASYPGAALAVGGLFGGRQATFSAEPDGIRIGTKNMAYIMNEPRIKGVLATQTGVFNGGMEFVGGFESLDIIALPGKFLANFE
jgi:hypothetical protein